MCVEPTKQNGLKRLLEVGGATVLSPSQFAKSTDKITHAFLNPSSRDPHLSIQTLIDKGIHCMRPDYIAEYLQKVNDHTHLLVQF